MKLTSRVGIIGIGAIAIMLAAACGGTAQAQAGGTVKATLTDMKITLDRTTVPAGPVTFVVTNSGALEHELVVLQTSTAEDKLAADADEEGKMDETGNVGETGDMDKGTTKTFTVTLPAGHYILMCNEVGHYSAGMHMSFTVN